MCTQIYEIGGGSGICAKGILDYIMLNAPARIYNNMTYTYVGLPSLCLSWNEYNPHILTSSLCMPVISILFTSFQGIVDILF